VIVLAHEFGHCLACRWSGGDADEILMWPLGGLAYCRPPHRWKAHLITAAGGPLINVILCLVAGTLLGSVTGHWLGVAIPNPLDLAAGIYVAEVRPWPILTLFIIHYTSLVLLLFNLLPIFPLDGGRIVQSLLWPRVGYSRSMHIAVRVGFIGAIVLGVFGAVMSKWMLVGIALFGGVTCYLTLKQLQWSDSMLEFESDEYALSLHGGKEEPEGATRPTYRQRRAQKQAAREQQEAEEVDRILQKIADSGMDSLSRAERSLLRRVTERKQQGG
jgi:Zn-dependent protease